MSTKKTEDSLPEYHEHHLEALLREGNPDVIKEIRIALSATVAATDRELEESVKQFIQWWKKIAAISQRDACCRPVSSNELSPLPPSVGLSHH